MSSQNKYLVIFFCLLVFLALTVLISLMTGRYMLMPTQVINILSNGTSAAAFDMEVEVELKQGGYLPVENHPALAHELMDFFEEKEGIELIDIEPAMTGEDFGYLLSKVDGVMFWLGIDSPYALHHPQMSPKEEALAIGVDAVSSFLKKKAAE